MKKFFRNPELTILTFNTEDIVMTSGTLPQAQNAVEDVQNELGKVSVHQTKVVVW